MVPDLSVRIGVISRRRGGKKKGDDEEDEGEAKVNSIEEKVDQNTDML